MRPLANSGIRVAIAAAAALLFSLSAHAQQTGAITETHTTTPACAACKNAQNLQEGNDTVDSATAIKGRPGSMTETLTESDSIGITKSVHVTMTENFTTVPSLSGLGNNASLVETHTTTATCTASHCNPVPIVEGNVTVDAVAALRSQTPLVENLTESDSVSTIRSLHKSMSETVTESDSVTGSKALHSVVMTETLTESDSCSGAHCNAVPIVDGHVTVDSVSAVIAQKVGNMTETLTPSDAVSVVRCFTFPAEQLTESDMVGWTLNHSGNMTENLFQIVDAVSIRTQRRESLVETLTESDSVSAIAIHHVAMIETLSHSDSIPTPHAAHVANMTDSVSEADLVLGAKNGNPQTATMTDTVMEADSVSGTAVHFASITDSVSESDSVSTFGTNINATIMETLSHSDVATWQSGKGMTETLAHSDTLFVLTHHNGSMTDTVAESDSLTVSFNSAQFFVNMVDNLLQIQQLASEDFTIQPDQNPLDPAFWSPGPSLAPLQIVSGAVQATTTLSDAGESYTGQPFSADQFASITIGSVGNLADDAVAPAVRQNDLNGYFADVQGPLGTPSASITLILSTDEAETVLGTFTGLINRGDTIGIAVRGNLLTVTLNGVTEISAIDGTITTGQPGIVISTDSSEPLSSNSVTGFAAGAPVPVDSASATTARQVTMSETLATIDSIFSTIPHQWFGTMSDTNSVSDFIVARPPLGHKRFILVESP